MGESVGNFCSSCLVIWEALPTVSFTATWNSAVEWCGVDSASSRSIFRKERKVRENETQRRKEKGRGRGRKGAGSGGAGRQARIESCLPMINYWWKLMKCNSWTCFFMNHSCPESGEQKRWKQVGEVSGRAEWKLLTWRGVLLTRGCLHPFLEGTWGLFNVVGQAAGCVLPPS